MVTFVISHVVLVVFLPTWFCNSMGRNAGGISLRCCSTCWTHPQKGWSQTDRLFIYLEIEGTISSSSSNSQLLGDFIRGFYHVPMHIQSRARQFFPRFFFVSQPLPPIFLVQRFLVMNQFKNPCHKLLKISWKLRFGYRICISPQDCQCGGGVSKSIQRFTSSDDYGLDDVCLSLCRYGLTQKKTAQKGKGKRPKDTIQLQVGWKL